MLHFTPGSCNSLQQMSAKVPKLSCQKDRAKRLKWTTHRCQYKYSSHILGNIETSCLTSICSHLSSNTSFALRDFELSVVMVEAEGQFEELFKSFSLKEDRPQLVKTLIFGEQIFTACASLAELRLAKCNPDVYRHSCLPHIQLDRHRCCHMDSNRFKTPQGHFSIRNPIVIVCI